MRKIILLVVILFTIAHCDAQSISMESISSGGQFFSNANCRLSFTTGEVMSATHTNGTTTLIEGFQQQYYTYWVGTAGTSWNNLVNWSGGPVPASKTDVIILTVKPNYPVLTVNASCRSLQVRPATTVTVTPGFKLTITN